MIRFRRWLLGFFALDEKISQSLSSWKCDQDVSTATANSFTLGLVTLSYFSLNSRCISQHWNFSLCRLCILMFFLSPYILERCHFARWKGYQFQVLHQCCAGLLDTLGSFHLIFFIKGKNSLFRWNEFLSFSIQKYKKVPFYALHLIGNKNDWWQPILDRFVQFSYDYGAY